jgi:hypothetical protein
MIKLSIQLNILVNKRGILSLILKKTTMCQQFVLILFLFSLFIIFIVNRKMFYSFEIESILFFNDKHVRNFNSLSSMNRCMTFNPRLSELFSYDLDIK